MNRIIIILFSLLGISLYSQDATAYNAIYPKIFLDISQKDFPRSLKMADSLYKVSETPLFQTRSLMLSASLYEQAGERGKAIEYAEKAHEIIKDTEYENWKARVYGFLASQYRFLDLYDKSKGYLDLAMESSKHITNMESASNLNGMMLIERAYFNISRHKYRNAILDLNKARPFIDKIKQDHSFFIANQEQLLGLNYYQLKDYHTSLNHYQKALEASEAFPENYMTGLIHTGLCILYMERNELSKAKKHLDIAQRLADTSKYLAFKNEVYDASKRYFALIKDVDQFIEADRKQQVAKQTLNKRERSYVADTYNKIEKQNIEIRKTNSLKSIILTITSICLAFVVLYFIWYRRKQRKNIEEFKQILAGLDQRASEVKKDAEQQALSNTSELQITEGEKTRDNSKVPAIVKEKILIKLSEFEDSELFTDNEISLSRLATFCETNTKYLSSIINTHKEKDFNNYINDLRINYIIHKLRTVPVYRKYKVATLASEAGFSSYNKFSLVFKKSTTITPSLFIKYLEESEMNTKR